MKLIRDTRNLPPEWRGGALTIGNFDGVHRGHVRILQKLKQSAARVGGPAIVFTFEPHPARILRPELAPIPLTWTDRKADLLAEVGVDVIVAYPTDKALLELEYDQFFELVVRQHIGAKALVEGPNFCFGRNRKGTIPLLKELCRKASIELHVVEPLVTDSEFVSSSRIRNLIRDGDVATAARFLTHPYRIRGMVTHGDARGTGLGFPTANLEAVDTLIPAFGVYAGRAHVGHRPHWAAIHIGPNPTFGQLLPKVEAHILDFEESLYGEVLEIDFVRRLRDIRSFDSAAELRAQVEQDITQTRQVSQAELDSSPPERSS